MISKELITIIVPVYNVSYYVERCILSICVQSYRNIEILIIDDGSTDGSGLICDRIANRDERIIVVHKRNSGLSDARNVGLEIANGQYIAFVDGDDYIHPNMIEVLYTAVKTNDADIGMCGRTLVDVKGNKLKTMFTLDHSVVYSGKEGIKHILTYDTCDMAVWDKLYNRELFANIRFPVDVLMCEDYQVMPQLMFLSNRIIHVGSPLYYYVQREDSITKDLLTDRRIKVLEQVKNTEIFLLSKYDDIDEHINYFWGINLSSVQGFAVRNRNPDMINGMVEVYEKCKIEKNRVLKSRLLSFSNKAKFIIKNVLLKIRITLLQGECC